jgi:hypothetical protein
MAARLILAIMENREEFGSAAMDGCPFDSRDHGRLRGDSTIGIP